MRDDLFLTPYVSVHFDEEGLVVTAEFQRVQRFRISPAKCYELRQFMDACYGEPKEGCEYGPETQPPTPQTQERRRG